MGMHSIVEIGEDGKHAENIVQREVSRFEKTFKKGESKCN